ncbi:MAG: 2-oxoglutarate dehydrogenase E1 component [Thermaerobacter sp.]|nr:2-oxoglutarate dehydrogenase E1 component [Thermaerobacter sp.]
MADLLQDPRALVQSLYGPNAGYALELYERYQTDPLAVDENTREFFRQWGPQTLQLLTGATSETVRTTADTSHSGLIAHVVKARQLARNIREFGHLQSQSDPLNVSPRRVVDDPEVLGLQDADLAALPDTIVWPKQASSTGNCLEAINRLRAIYSGSIGYDFSHVHNFDEREWLRDQVESGKLFPPLTDLKRRALLFRLTEVEGFERFLHTAFPGQKRFSIEGTDTLVPMLDELISLAVHTGTREVVMGMAHRGRLNVLAHVLGKPYGKIFSEFHTAVNKDLVPSEGSHGINVGWTGDVKYHLGAHKTLHEVEMVQVRLTLANNPSHLEFVDPVVEGMARAAQEDLLRPGHPTQNPDWALAVLIHGDASFPGEGVVAETLNLSRLAGYHTGGTVHIIMNNGLGFTTEPQASRSTLYASDLAKGFEIPVVHVSADDPEACLAVIRLAYAYRQQFHKDVLVDLVGYRRWGHNEGDEPSFTQPLLYDAIGTHPTVRALYGESLARRNLLTHEQISHMQAEVQTRLNQAKEAFKDHQPEDDADPLWEDGWSALEEPTAVPEATLRALNESLLARPDGFHGHSKLERQLDKRRANLDRPGGIDWAHAESLAFASILADGTPIRLSGQDSERGTFSQRHLVLHDVKTGRRHTPLDHLPEAKAGFAVYNSPLSEAGVLGFEYGYSVEAPHAIVIWEAQFGDFANAGQVLIDQFLAASRAKWKEHSGLVVLVPHGYEGQGPEHSSARLERYLQLAAEDNLRIANCTTASQYFHVLRQQAAVLRHDPRPLIIMTPKSLLRSPWAGSSLDDLVQGEFHAVLDDPSIVDPATVRRIVFCSGKVGLEALAAGGSNEEQVAVVRIEQLYPFPDRRVGQLIRTRYQHTQEVVWLQEEPKNMGAWRFVQPRLQAELPGAVPLRYSGRPDRAATAEGKADMHAEEQARLIREAVLQPTMSTQGGTR